MTEVTKPTTETTIKSSADLRAIGLAPREIYRLRVLRDCIGCYPHIEFFTNDEWRNLLFMKWRYDQGEYADDMPPDTIISNQTLDDE
jgi:hypothetical protein